MIAIYTDGSCGSPAPCPGGWAFVVYDAAGALLHEASGGATRTSNNRMEMLAIVRALEWAGGRECVIHSDSQLCVNTLTTWARSWEAKGWRKDRGEIKNLDVVQLAWDRFQYSAATLQWVRGHAGTAGNERADELAGLERAKRLSLAVAPV